MIGARIAELRRRRGMNPAQFAKRSGYTMGELSAIERLNWPLNKYQEQDFADTLGISVDQLLGRAPLDGDA